MGVTSSGSYLLEGGCQMLGHFNGDRHDIVDISADDLLQDSRQIVVFRLPDNVQKSQDDLFYVRLDQLLRSLVLTWGRDLVRMSSKGLRIVITNMQMISQGEIEVE